jgi:hypothetical protein
MSTNKNLTYTPEMIQPVIRVDTTVSSSTRSISLLHWLSGWLALWRKGKSDLIMAMDFELENVHFVEDGYYLISTEHAARERTIDTQWLILEMTRSR